MEDEIEVLLEIGESRKELAVERDHLVYAVEQELGRLGKDGVLAYFSCDPGSRLSTKEVYILQRWDDKWGTYVDVSDTDQLKTGDRLVCTLQQSQDNASSSRATVDFDTSKGKRLVSQSSNAAKSLKRVSQSHAQALADLFPSSTAKRPHLSSAFDPTAQCLAFHRHQQKKGNARIKPSRISFALVSKSAKGIPRGKHRKALESSKRIMKVDVFRTMSAMDVKRAVLKTFSHVNLTHFKYQGIDAAHRFETAANQDKDGDTIINSGAKGTIYIKEEVQEADSNVIEELPQAPFFASRPKINCDPVISDDPVVITDSEDNSVSIPGSGTSVGNDEARESLTEFHNIRAQQDREYLESLQIDRRKSEDANKVEQRRQVISQLREKLGCKYGDNDGPIDGVPIGFRLPDGGKVSHHFSLTDATKLLYEFIFSLSTNDHSFKIIKMLPTEVVPCSDTTTLSEAGLSSPSTLTVTFEEEEEEDVLAYFQVSVTEENRLNDNGKMATKAIEIIEMVDTKRLEFVRRICPVKPTLSHLIRRNMVYDDVMELFCNENALREFPLRINFKDEMAFDSGGVSRDMFSAFWEAAYCRFFEGTCLLTPNLHASTDMSVLPLLGRIISHGFLVSGYMPIRVAFPCMAGVLLGPMTDFSSSVLIEAFSESLCSYEAAIIKEALETSTFSTDLQTKVATILSRYGSRVCPSTSAQLRAQLLNVGKYEFLIKPMAAISAIHSGISDEEKQFWRNFSVNELHFLYLSLSATAEKVLNIIDEPVESNSNQARVFNYLQQYIGNMRNDEVRRFLRFTTGSSVLIAERISIVFNAQSGLSRHPIAHTCACTLELPSTYASYLEFEQEFNSILMNDEHTWEMHVI